MAAVERWHLPPQLELTHGIDSWNVREAGLPGSRVVGVIRTGQQFNVTARNGDWLQIELGPTKGWSYCKLPPAYGNVQALVPLRPLTQAELPSRKPVLRRSLSSQDHVTELLGELKARRQHYDSLRREAGPELMEAGLRLQETMDKLEILGVDTDRVLELEGVESLAEPSQISVSLVNELSRTTSYNHSDFTNPRSESCWLSTFFQSLWHSRVFHAAFECLVKPLPKSSPGTALAALQDTWDMYEHASAANALVPVNALVKAWGRGIGDAAEAFGKFHEEPELQPLSDMFALVPVPWTGKVPSMATLRDLVVDMGVQSSPLVVLDMVFPALARASMQTLALALAPAEDSEDLVDSRLVAMICFMEDFTHYVAFCRSLSNAKEWIFFNDLPGIARGIPKRFPDWMGVARACGRYGASPRMLLYENRKASVDLLKSKVAEGPTAVKPEEGSSCALM